MNLNKLGQPRKAAHQGVVSRIAKAGFSKWEMPMTEAEWLVSTDSYDMVHYLTYEHPNPSERKLRLLACAFCRHVWHLVTDENIRNSIEAAERNADGVATEQELRAAREADLYWFRWPIEDALGAVEHGKE